MLREQLRHLLAAPARGIPVRVVPEHRPHPLVLHSWLLMEFPNTSPVVTVEVRGGSVFLDDEVAGSYLAAVRELERVALPKPASMALIRTILGAGEPRPVT